ESTGVGVLDPAHPFDQIWFRRLDQPVIMIIHQYPGVYQPTCFVAGLSQNLEQRHAIFLVSEDPFSAVYSCHYVVNGTGILDANLPRHSIPLIEKPEFCQELLTDPFSQPTDKRKAAVTERLRTTAGDCPKPDGIIVHIQK